MIAKVHTISHGAAMTNYAMDKTQAEVVHVHLLPDDLSPSALWGRMMLHNRQTEGLRSSNHELKNCAIRIELSPSMEETEGWTIQDWQQLAEEFIREFDAVDMSAQTKRRSAAHTNLANSQYVVALHHDSNSGIPHLHIVANRVDMDGHVNNDHKIRERGWVAADIINRRRGWELPKDIRDQHIQQVSDDCMTVLRQMPSFTWGEYKRRLEGKDYKLNLRSDKTGTIVGYTVWMGNSKYKASELGTARNLMASKIEKTWQKLHAQSIQRSGKASGTPMRPGMSMNGTSSAVSVPVKPKSLVGRYAERQTANVPVRYVKDIPYKDGNCHIDIPQTVCDLLKEEATVHPDNDTATQENVLEVAMLLFAGYIDAATVMSESSGGGGSQPSDGWGRDKDDDEKWARRCAQLASWMSKPKPRYRRSR